MPTIDGTLIFMIRPVRKVIKLFPNSTAQLNRAFFMLINVKIPKIVCILTFIGMINTASESLKARKLFVFVIASVRQGMVG